MKFAVCLIRLGSKPVTSYPSKAAWIWVDYFSNGIGFDKEYCRVKFKAIHERSELGSFYLFKNSDLGWSKIPWWSKSTC